MKKIISFMIILLFSFYTISDFEEKRADAVATTLVFTAGVSLMAVAPVMQMLYANGMLMPMGDMISYVTNMLYDKSGDNYVAKAGQTSLLEDLEYYTTAMLTGNTVMDRTELKQRMQEFMDTNIPKPFNSSDVSTKPTIGEKYGIAYTHNHTTNFNPGTTTFADMVTSISTSSRDNLYFIKRNGVEVFLKLPRERFQYGYTIANSVVYENVKYIFPSGESIYLPVGAVQTMVYEGLNLLSVYNNNPSLWSTLLNPIRITDYFTDLIPRGQTAPKEYAPESYVTNPTLPFKMPSLNWYGALNGKAGTVDDLKGLINADEYLQLEILNLLQKQAVNEENSVIVPTIGADGKLYYPDNSIPDNPDIPYTPGETWYNNLYGWLVGMPDKIAEKVGDIPILGDIVGGITDLVGRVTDIWDWLRTGLLGILQSILNAILDILAFLVGLPAMLIQLLKDALIWLFVPDADFLKDKVDIFKENFTFIDSFKQFVLLFDDMTSQNRVPTITLDFSKFKGSLGGQSISMGGQAYVLDMRFYDAYRAIGDIMITAFVYLMFVWRFFGRLPEIISGGGLLYTADNKTNDIINKLEGKKK